MHTMIEHFNTLDYVRLFESLLFLPKTNDQHFTLALSYQVKNHLFTMNTTFKSFSQLANLYFHQ